MALGLAAVLFIIFAGSFSVFLFLSSRKRNKRWLIAGACVLGTLLLVLTVYIALTFLFLDAISNEGTLLETTESAETITGPTTSTVTYTESSSSSLTTPSAIPDDFELPVSYVPEFCHDILGLRDARYGYMPTFTALKDVSLYVLHSRLNADKTKSLSIAKFI